MLIDDEVMTIQMTSQMTSSKYADRSPRPTDEQKTSAAAEAVKDVAPLLVALIPFSVAIGAAAQTNGLSGVELVAGAVFVLAGAAQLAAIELIGAGTSWVVVVLTALAINLRFMLYSAGFARWFSGAPLRHRLAMAATIVDQNFMISAERFSNSSKEDDADSGWRSRYFTTASAAMIAVFFSCQVVGYRLGASLPDGLGLHMAVPLAFSGLLAKSAATSSSRIAAGTAVVVALLAVGLPAGMSLPLAAVVGVIVGSSVSADRT